MKRLHPTLIELWIGIVLWSILAAGVGVWFCKDKPAWFFGIIFGTVAAFALAFYMKQSVDRLVDDLEAGRGDRIIRSSAMIRLLISAATIAIACFVPFFNPIGAFLGLLTMKFAAYSNPLIHGITKKMHPYFADKEYPPEEMEGETSDLESEAETAEGVENAKDAPSSVTVDKKAGAEEDSEPENNTAEKKDPEENNSGDYRR